MVEKINILEKSSTDLRIKIKHKENSNHVEIFDSKNNNIGGISMITNKEFGLSNADGITILRSTEISRLIFLEYHVKDKEGKSIGLGKQKGLFNINFSLEKEGIESLHTEKSRGRLDIKNKTGEIIGQIISGSKDKEKFFNLQIIDLDFDRLELLGLFLFAYHYRFRWTDKSKGDGGSGE